MEREILEEIEIAHDDGSLRREAVGWSRRPLHRCNLAGARLRKKRWEFWCIESDDHLFAVTLADIEYLGLVVITFVDFATRETTEKLAVRPLGLPERFPDRPRGGDMAVSAQGVSIEIREEAAGTRIEASSRGLFGASIEASLLVERPAGHESLNLLVPWSEHRYQYTSKHCALPAHGMVRVGGDVHRIGPQNKAFACLDFGRGVWPYRTEWNWGHAAGIQEGRVVGLNLGGRWTDGTGVTENGLFLDGRLHKIHEPVDFQYDRSDFSRPWRVRSRASDRVDLVFTPWHLREPRLPLGVLHAELHHALGSYRGRILDDTGAPIEVDGLRGWAEEVRARW